MPGIILKTLKHGECSTGNTIPGSLGQSVVTGAASITSDGTGKTIPKHVPIHQSSSKVFPLHHLYLKSDTVWTSPIMLIFKKIYHEISNEGEAGL